jgi:undecaprenyl-diphosphatase
VTHLFHVVGPWAPLIVLVLAAAESAAFIGVLAPGELAVVLGGVTAGAGGVSVWLMIPAAVVGAVVGDSIGYSLGRRLGPALLSHPRMARFSKHIDAAGEMLSNRGWWALVVARFAAVLRAVVPFAAGMARMRYRRFLLGNAVGGVLWGAGFTLLGYVAGANYTRVERWVRAGGLAVVALALLVGAVVWLTRWTARNRDTVDRWLDRIAAFWPLRPLAVGIRRGGRPAITLLMTAGAITASLTVFGLLVVDVVGASRVFFFDGSAIRYLDANRIPALIDVARVMNVVTAPAVIGTGAALAGAVLLVRRRVRPAGAVAVAVIGQWLIVELTEMLVHRSPPAAAPLVSRIDAGFPSEHVALVTAVACLLAWPWRRGGWVTTVLRFGNALGVVVVTAAARVVLLVEFPSDTVAAAAVAASWTLLTCLAFDPGPRLPETEAVAEE